MHHAIDRRGLLPRFLTGAAVALVAVAALALAPGASRAYDTYQHGGIEDCETCHVNAHTWWTPTNEHCLTCHTGYQAVRRDRLCWTCHMPGQDMDWARADAGCTSTCHLRGGATFAHTGHAAAPALCTGCHPVSAAPSDPSGSPHHVVPAPELAAVAPLAAPPGATVTLTGRRLSWAAIVRFGGVNADFSVVSDERLDARVPAAAVSGPVTVLSPGGTAGLAGFAVLANTKPALTLRVTPAMVRPGRRVRIAGSLTPAGSGAAKVAIVVQRRVAGVWKLAAAATRAPDVSGEFRWDYRPRRTGVFRTRASSSAPAAATSSWARFRSIAP